MTISPDQIPPEVVEAAARAIHACEYDAEHYPFDQEDIVQQGLLRSQARAAIAAALNAWPNAWTETGFALGPDVLIIPLPKENSDG